MGKKITPTDTNSQDSCKETDEVNEENGEEKRVEE